MDRTRNVKYSDWLGASASGLCIIHCALTPLIFAAKPVFYGMIGKPVHSHGVWAGLDYVFLIVSFLAVWYSTRDTHHATLKWIFWVAWIVFAFGLVYESYELDLGHWLMYAGSITLVITHIKNYYYSQSCTIKMSS